MNDEQRKLAEENINLAYMVANRYGGREDIAQECMFALCKAALSYNPEIGAFSTYAVTIIENHLHTRHRLGHAQCRFSPELNLSMDAVMGDGENSNEYTLYDMVGDCRHNTEREAICNVMVSDPTLNRIAPLSMMMYHKHLNQFDISRQYGCTRQYISYFLDQERRWVKHYLDHGDVPQGWINRADNLRRRLAV